jgi:hypothetical protein
VDVLQSFYPYRRLPFLCENLLDPGNACVLSAQLGGLASQRTFPYHLAHISYSTQQHDAPSHELLMWHLAQCSSNALIKHRQLGLLFSSLHRMDGVYLDKKGCIEQP